MIKPKRRCKVCRKLKDVKDIAFIGLDAYCKPCSVEVIMKRTHGMGDPKDIR